MATTSYGQPSSPQIINGNIASIAADGQATVGTVNNAGGSVYGNIELEVQFSTAPNANETIELYFLKSVDQGEFETGDGAGESLVPPQQIQHFMVDAVTTLQRLVLDSIILPNCDFEVVLVNSTSQATDAGATMKLATFNMQAS